MDSDSFDGVTWNSMACELESIACDGLRTADEVFIEGDQRVAFLGGEQMHGISKIQTV